MTTRVLVIGGFDESLVNFRGALLETLLARGIEVHAAAPGLSPDSVHGRTLAAWGVLPHAISLQRTGVNPAQDARTALELLRLILLVRPTHLLAYTVKPIVYGALAARVAGVQHITALITGLGYAFTLEEQATGRKLLQSVLRLLYKSALHGAHRVVFQNPDDRDLFVSLGLAAAERCALISGSGVQLDTFHVAPLPPVTPGLSFALIARLLRDKGIYEFVEAARLVREAHPQAQFHVVGWRDTNPAAISPQDLERWIADGTIVYHGRLDDVRPVLARCHVYVLPSYREGTPRTVLEAMAMGRPIITTDVPGCRETVEHGKNGWLVPARDPRALAEAMLRFVREPSLLESMGRASREVAVNKYDVRKVNEALIAQMGIEHEACRAGAGELASRAGARAAGPGIGQDPGSRESPAPHAIPGSGLR